MVNYSDLKDLSANELSYYNKHSKSNLAGYLWLLFLGGAGAHKFYYGSYVWGIVYLLFFWTYIPCIVSLIELFFIKRYTNDYNEKLLFEIGVTKWREGEA